MRIINKIRKNSFLSSIFLISGGTALAQIISILGSPIITRFYSSEEYGILTIYVAFISVISSIGAFKYEWAIPISENEEEAENVLLMCIILVILTTLFLFLFFLTTGEVVFKMTETENLEPFSFFIPIGYLFTTLYIIFSQWALRRKDFLSISQTKLIQSFSQNVVKILFGLLKFGPIGLIIGNIIGQSSGILRLSKGTKKIFSKKISENDILKIKKIAIKYKKFPLYSAPSQILNTLGLQLPTILLGYLYGVEVIGYYGLAMSVVSLPMNFIGNSVADVFYSEIATNKGKDTDKIKRLSISLLKKLLLIGLVPLIVLIIFGPLLFEFIYGDGWREAGVYSRILAFLVYARFVFTPLSRVYQVYQKQREAFILDFVRVLLIVLTFILSVTFKLNEINFLTIYTIGLSIIYLVTYIGTLKILNEVKNTY